MNVYILETKKKTFYTGIAKDVFSRFFKHVKKNGAKYTKAFPVKILLLSFQVDTKQEALVFEKKIKKLKKKHKIKAFLDQKNVIHWGLCLND